jgi:hypothetical protein
MNLWLYSRHFKILHGPDNRYAGNHRLHTTTLSAELAKKQSLFSVVRASIAAMPLHFIAEAERPNTCEILSHVKKSMCHTKQQLSILPAISIQQCLTGLRRRAYLAAKGSRWEP